MFDAYGIAIIVTGALVAGACAFVGCFLVLRRMALLGDAISHSVLLGIVLAFLITHDRGIVPMFVGAAAAGLATAAAVQALQHGGVRADAAIGVTFTALFALGVVLLTLYASDVHLDLEHVLYGEIAYAPWDVLTVGGLELGPRAAWVMGGVFALNLIVIGLFFKEFAICAFDAGMAAALGIPVAVFHYLMMGLVSVTAVAAFESAGAILTVAMLVVPGAAAHLLTDNLKQMLGLSVAIGAFSSVGGYALALWLDSSISGAMTVVLGLVFALALALSPTHGILGRYLARREAATSPGDVVE